MSGIVVAVLFGLAIGLVAGWIAWRRAPVSQGPAKKAEPAKPVTAKKDVIPPERGRHYDTTGGIPWGWWQRD